MAYRDQKDAIRALTGLATSQGGYFTAKQAAEAGYDYSHLAYHVKVGNFERTAHGLYRFPLLPLSEHDDLLRLSFWSRDRLDRSQATVSHQTAIALYELGELIPGEIHLTVPPLFRKRAPRGCRLHKRPLRTVQSKTMWGIRVTTPLQTLEDLAADPSFPTEQFYKATEAAASRGLIRSAQRKDLLNQRKNADSRRAERKASE